MIFKNVFLFSIIFAVGIFVLIEGIKTIGEIITVFSTFYFTR